MWTIHGRHVQSIVDMECRVDLLERPTGFEISTPMRYIFKKSLMTMDAPVSGSYINDDCKSGCSVSTFDLTFNPSSLLLKALRLEIACA